MRSFKSCAIASLLVFCFLPASKCLAGKGTVEYVVTVEKPEQKRLKVSITVDPSGHSSIRFQMPAWTPGYYQLLDFEKNVSNFKGFDGSGRELNVTSINPATWQVTAGAGAVTVKYDVKAEDAGFGFFGSHVDAETGYMNGPSALMYVEGGKDLPATLRVSVPRGWKVACSLDREGADVYRAADYDELVDCPVQMGIFERHDFEVKGIPFAAILVGESNVDRKALIDTFSRISAAGIEIMGYAPFKRYYYLVHFDTGNFGGGLEHRNSTILNVWGMISAQKHPWAALSAHEFFHLYNVKRIRPAVLGPFDYRNKTRTTNLWFAEGVTEYYAHVILRKARITSEGEFLRWMSNEINTLFRTPARSKISAEEASMKGWEGGSIGFGGLSYYLKGSLLGLFYDIGIRDATDGKRSLDDVLKLLEEKYARASIGYPEDGILQALNEVSGVDMSSSYANYVRGTEEIPWGDILQKVGLRFAAPNEKQAFLGIGTARGKKSVASVEEVIRESPAAASGIKGGDSIITFNGAKVTYDSWPSVVSRLKPGQKITLQIRRKNRLVPISFKVGSRPVSQSQIVSDDKAHARAKRLREGLFRSREASNPA